jgi:uncharacterized membrane protein YfcA
MPNEFVPTKLDLSRLLSNVAGLFLSASGLIILAWIGWLTWYDLTSSSKDIALIFFGSRIGKAISLGIGMKLIHYFLTSLALLLSGLRFFEDKVRFIILDTWQVFLRALLSCKI